VTISPTTPGSTVLPGSPAGESGTPGDPASDGFAALLAMLAGGQTPITPPVPPVTPVTPVTPVPTTPAAPATTTTTVPAVPTATPMVTPPPALPQPAGGIVHDEVHLFATEMGAEGRGLSPQAAATSPVLPLSPGTTTAPTATPARPTKQAGIPIATTVPATTTTTTAVAKDAELPEPVPVLPQATTEATPRKPAAKAEPATDAPDAPLPLPPLEAPVAQMSETARTAAPLQVAGSAPRALTPVTTQVVPELNRLVSQGDGTHRVTLRLQPAALGDVRVVLTVRAGTVRVSLAANADARAALLADAPALHRMLTGTGAESTRIVVRDLLGTQPGTLAPATPVSSSNDATTSDPGNTNNSGAFGPSHHDSPGHRAPGEGQARTPGHTSAMDGRSSDGGHPVPRRPIDQDTVTPLAGVDVTM